MGTDKCPICNNGQCTAHLLASFDADPGEGEFGIGLVGGTLFDVEEIGELLTKVTRAWVDAIRSAERPTTPAWIKNNRYVSHFYDAIGNAVNNDEVRSASQEDAQYIAQEEGWAMYARYLVEDLTSESGWGWNKNRR
jgi:hypothetical protein